MAEEMPVLPPGVAEALDKAIIHERTPGDDHHRVAVALPGGRTWIYEGMDDAVTKLAQSMALEQEQAIEAAKHLDARIRGMVRTARRQRRAANAWVNNF